MTIVDAGNSRWEIIAETTPSGVTNVVHTGCENYDWIVAEFSEVETSASALISMEIGYGATPTYVASHYIRITTVQSQFNFTPWYPEGSARTADRRASWIIPNNGKRFNDTGDTIELAVCGSGYSNVTASLGMMLGIADMPKVPVTAIRYAATSGNLQGTGAVIRTWGYR